MKLGQRKSRNRQAAALPRPNYALRRNATLLLILVVSGFLILAAWYQQVNRTDFLSARADNIQLREVSVTAQRGRILDRNDEVLAVSTPVDSIWADPRILRQDSETVQILAQALGQDADALRQRLVNFSDKHFVYLHRWMTPHDAKYALQTIQDAGIRGVSSQREYRRYYPAGEVFAHVVGFAGMDDKGQEGIEYRYEEQLRPRNGRNLIRRDLHSRLYESVEIRVPAMSGQDIHLSLDRRLQYFAYRALMRAMQQHGTKSASLVLLDVKTGEVLAMVNQPSYNPNGDRSNSDGRLRNRAVVDTFEPGSTIKPITIATALQYGVISPTTKIEITGRGSMRVGNREIKDPQNYGVLDPAGILLKSSNVGAAFIARSMGKEAFWKMFDAFGFGASVGVGFPGETSGYLPDYTRWADIDHANLSFGYALSVSTLQLAQAYAVIAADGVKRPITLIKDNSVGFEERVLDAAVAQDVRTMMQQVTTDAHAPKAAIPGYRISGKTGTTRMISSKGDYSEDRYRALFAGMAPAEDPRLVLVVMFEEPQGNNYYGSQVAAPVFAEVMEHALRLLNIPPDGDEQRDSAHVLTAGALQ
jgi:cell division protein FtsI (penicillin-binding protein 3)